MPRSVCFAHDENGERRPSGEGFTALSLASPRQESVFVCFYEYACTPRGPKSDHAMKEIADQGTICPGGFNPFHTVGNFESKKS